MLLYQTDDKGVVFGGPFLARESPKEPGVFHFPRGSKSTPLPPLGKRETARTTGPAVDAPWEVIPDWRGFTYWTPEREQVTIEEAGVEPPADHLLEDPGPTPSQRLAARIAAAEVALRESDITVIRCAEHGVPLPQEWKDYRAELRAVARGEGDPDAPLPAQPNQYPVGS